MDKKPHIAIIILNWNGQQDTITCLQSVSRIRYPHFSVTVIDNGSEQDDLKAIKAACPQMSQPVIFLQNDRNLGFSGGNNVAIKQALKTDAELIFTLNNDTEAESTILDEAVTAWQKHSDKRLGILATKMVNAFDHHRLDNAGHDLLSTGDSVPHGRDEAPSQHNQERFTMGACAGAAFYSADMLREIGLFDEDFFLNYEDSDLSFRGLVQGWRCLYVPKAIVYHQINASIKKVKNSSYRVRSQRNQLWAYFHNIPLPVIFLNFPWIVLRELLIPLVSLVTFRWTITGIFFRSRFAFLKSLPLVLKKRRQVLKNQQISSWQIWKSQRSWFSVYWDYFKKIVLKRQQSVME